MRSKGIELNSLYNVCRNSTAFKYLCYTSIGVTWKRAIKGQLESVRVNRLQLIAPRGSILQTTFYTHTTVCKPFQV